MARHSQAGQLLKWLVLRALLPLSHLAWLASAQQQQQLAPNALLVRAGLGGSTNTLGRLVIAADQTLSIEGSVFSGPSITALVKGMLQLSGDYGQASSGPKPTLDMNKYWSKHPAFQIAQGMPCYLGLLAVRHLLIRCWGSRFVLYTDTSQPLAVLLRMHDMHMQ